MAQDDYPQFEKRKTEFSGAGDEKETHLGPITGLSNVSLAKLLLAISIFRTVSQPLCLKTSRPIII
jgi:hypothetical protein